MKTVHIALTIFLLLLPGIITSLYRPLSPDADRARIRKSRLALWIATAAAFALYALLWLGESAGWFAFWPRLPFLLRWSDSPLQLAWLLQFVLWFPFGVRVLAAVRPEAAGPHPASVKRSASLRPRSAAIPFPTLLFASGWALVALGLGAILFRAASAESAAATHGFWPSLDLLAGAALPLVLLPFVLRLSALEPEPLDPESAPDLEEAYVHFRRFRARAFAMIALCMSALLSLLAAASVWTANSALLGWVGGLGGAVVGCVGGALGILTSNRRMRLRRRLTS